MPLTTALFHRRQARRVVAASVVAVAALGLTATAGNAAPVTGHTPAAATAHQAPAVQKGVSGTWLGTLEYLTQEKLIVAPKSGLAQAFYVGPQTKVLGAAGICAANGNVTVDDQGYGTSPCTHAQLEKAAKMNAIEVRVTVKDGIATAIVEHYHS
ncbi:hypothetical protein ACFVTP_12115 [Streptomyces celluloflavus]|uniref:hypothetical protein n=1 Tax=Streptomyces celluloflavus TaxID=58344 RepID=UPI0036DA258D